MYRTTHNTLYEGLTRGPMDDVRCSESTNVASDCLHKLLLELRAVLNVLHEGDVCIDSLPLHWMLKPACKTRWS